MKEKLRSLGRSRATAAIAGGAIALMLGGGTAVAAGHIGTDDIQDYSITKQKLKRDSVGSWEVKNRTLHGGDIKLDSVGQRVFTPHLRDLINQKGAPGEDGVSGYEVIAPEERFAVGSHTMTAECPDGKYAISGGYEASADGANGANTTVQASQASDLVEQSDGTWRASSWSVRFTVDDAAPQGMGNMKVIVTCAVAK